MSLSTLRCPNCGNAEQIRKQQLGEDILYYCPSCASEFYERLAKREYERLHSAIKSDVGSMIDEAVLNMKLEEYYNLRSMLCKEATAEYIDSKAIVKICRDILKSFPDDCIANFFLTANSGTRQEVADAINEIDAQENEASMGLVLNFMIKSLKEEYVDAMAALLERCGKIFSPEKKQEYFTKFEKEAKKVREGIYEIGLSRDVFLAYSSKDMPAVIKLLNFIESSEIGLTCFAAFRNLQHGRDAVANYENALKEAIDSCDIFLFVSSVNSRSINCDAFKVEMAYIKNSEMKQHPECRSYAQLPEKYRKLRIEYRLDNRPTPLVDRNMKEFFAGLTYVEDHYQLVERLGYCLDRLSEGYDEPDDNADTEDKRKAETESKVIAEIEARAKLEAEAKIRAEAEARAKWEAEVRSKAEAEAKAKAEAELVAKRKAEEEAKRKAEEEAKRKADEEARLNVLQERNAKLAIARQQGFEIINGVLTKYNGEQIYVVIPDIVTTIGESAFKKGKVVSVTIPNSVTSIGDKAFYNCDSLTGITIPSSVTTIGDEAFSDCYSLTGITIPSSVTSIGGHAFSYCKSLTNIAVDANNKYYKDIDGNLYTKDGKTLIKYARGKKDISFAIPDGVTTIYCNAFAYCDSLTSITIPSSVTIICVNAFYNCRNLTRIQYRGTSSQWSAITKGAKWDDSVGNYTIMYNW